MVSIRRMTAGNGYKYLLKTGVAVCHTEQNRTGLSSEIATAGKGWEMSQCNALLK